MTDQNSASVKDTKTELEQLRELFQSESEKKQLQLLPQFVVFGEPGLASLRAFLQQQQSSPPNLVMGKAYQLLSQANDPTTTEFLQTEFPQGVVPLGSERNLDYLPIQKALAQADYQQADRLTLAKLCELAGEAAIARKWLYFTEVESFPVTDLATIDQLWFIYSEGKFGFSVQRELWLALGKDFAKLWPKIGWKSGNKWTTYPHEFTWDLSAPKGHLPLSNQLRGVRVFASLLNHPAWTGD
ncbi:MAG: GUN4 N-terminal ARM-like repeat domain-containing protein [Oscillatoria sp. PMC 1068.18]|nr:GUN4 N-terminal ARM-like repeat domain-containing protein [Oscillatoria sp. PMC 1076.18]MEC4991740.1 GUN4 N-terminal ARM-like repeat domain-containing protein [Oscillatoria sp. PMC 1068.18]